MIIIEVTNCKALHFTEVTTPFEPSLVKGTVYELFLQYDYTGDNIYYLATEEIDINNDRINDVDGSPTNRNLELAITQWAADKLVPELVEGVGPERALTVYLMDHGAVNRLYLNGPPETVTPDQLDSWLDTLEEAAPGVRINVIVEACHAGSFIQLEQSVSQQGRVVIASTGTHPLAYASENGAHFSDAFISALGRGKSLYGAFDEARTIAQTAHPSQSAWSLSLSKGGSTTMATPYQTATRTGKKPNNAALP